MNTLEITTTTPVYTTAEHNIVALVVTPICFTAFSAAVKAAQARGKDESSIMRALFRERIKRQVKAKQANGTVVAMTDELITKMPLPYALRLKDAINEVAVDLATKKVKDIDVPVQPEIITKGDGIVTPILVALGSPIQMQGGKQIAELEFLASTFGELEAAVLSDNQIERTIDLLAIAKPVGADLSLTSLPSWALDQISLEDGLWLTSQVTPSFFAEASS